MQIVNVKANVLTKRNRFLHNAALLVNTAVGRMICKRTGLVKAVLKYY
jgi:hypothetical protein